MAGELRRVEIGPQLVAADDPLGKNILLHWMQRIKREERTRQRPMKRIRKPCSGSGSAW